MKTVNYRMSSVLSIIGITLIIASMVLYRRLDSVLFLCIALALVLLVEIQQAFWFNCPKCRRHMGRRRVLPPKVCPRCGARLGFARNAGVNKEE